MFSVPPLELLDDMHNKLSEAVKLYDHLLTQRVSQPARRSQASYAPPYQQPAQGHSSVYNQWQPTSAAQPSYVPQIAQAQASTSTGYPLQMYGQYSGPVSAHSPEPESGYQTSFAPISLPQSPVYGGAPVSIPQLQPASAAPASPAVSFNAPQAPAQPQSPLPQRHVIASPPPAASYRPHVQQYDQPVQQVQPPASAPAPTMPNFPVAPTLPPTSFSLNEASPIPAGIAQPDRKEALLIDL